MKGKILILILGILVGVAAALLWPRFVSPRLPAGLRSGLEAVDGTVVRKQRDGERLLLTVDTPQGAALATFTEKVAEIDLLVEEGDGVTLGLQGYEPFIHNPAIRGVRKGAAAPPMTSLPAAGSGAAAGEEVGGEPAAVEEESEVPAPGEEPPAELEEWPGTAAEATAADG